MKKLFLTLFILLIFLSSSFAQPYVPMPTDSAWWHCRSVAWTEPTLHLYDHLVYVNGEDTLWDGVTYTKLMLRSAHAAVPNGGPEPTTFIANQPDRFIGGIRETNRMVYVRDIGQPEHLFFNFNHQVGDIVSQIGSNISRVTDIDQIPVGDTYRKRFVVTTTPGNSIETYVAGIGRYTIGVIDVNAGLQCYHSEQYYNNGNYIPGTNGGPVYNTAGQKAYSHSLSKGMNTIDVSQLPQGLYNVVVRDEQNAVVSNQKLIKQ